MNAGDGLPEFPAYSPTRLTVNACVYVPAVVNVVPFVDHRNVNVLPTRCTRSQIDALLLITVTGVLLFALMSVLSKWALGGWHESETPHD